MVVQRHHMQRRIPVAKIAVRWPKWAEISRAPFEAIADEPLYDDVRQLSDVSPLTLRHLVPSSLRNALCGAVFPLGLLDRVVAKLEARGWRVAVDGSTKADFFFPNSDSANQASSGRGMLDHICGRALSLAHVPRSSDRVRIVATVRTQFTEAHLLVVTKNQREAIGVAKRLEKRIGLPVTYGNQRRTGFPWTHVDGVNTFDGRHLPDWQFVVFWNAELVTRTTAFVHLSRMWESIRIGFLTRDERHLHPLDRALIEGMFGPVIFRPATPHEAATSVSVSFLPAPTYPACQPDGQLDRKRSYLWQNVARTRYIASAALALANRNRREASKHGLETAYDWLASGELGQVPICGFRPSVAVVVENLEHARALARALAQFLPGWSVQSANDFDPMAPLVTGKAIVTLPLAAKVTLAPDVVLFAAGCGEAWFNEYGDACAGLTGDRMLIVDVEDDFDAQAIEEVRCRKADYRRRGWHSVHLGTGT